MVRALFPHAFRGRRLVNRDRFRPGGGQFERIGLPGLVVAPPDRRSCLCPYLLQEPGFEKLGDGPLRLGAFWTRWPNQAMIIALRRSAQQHKLRVVEFDRHVWTLAFREPADPGPSLTRAPDRGWSKPSAASGLAAKASQPERPAMPTRTIVRRSA